MLKLVDIKGALERRSYPPELEGGLILDITADDTSSWNGGRWLIEWTGGKARAHRTRRTASHLPSLPVTIQQLALVYCGTRTARQLATDGFLQASPAAIAFLDAAFPPGTPYIEEWF